MLFSPLSIKKGNKGCLKYICYTLKSRLLGVISGTQLNSLKTFLSEHLRLMRKKLCAKLHFIPFSGFRTTEKTVKLYKTFSRCQDYELE